MLHSEKLNKKYSIVFGVAITLLTTLFFVGLYFIPRVDEPSSTASIGIIIAAFMTLTAGIVALVIAMVIASAIDRKVARSETSHPPQVLKKRVLGYLLAGFVVFLTVLFVVAWEKNKVWNEKNTPGIKFDSGILEKKQILPEEIANYDPERNGAHFIGYLAGSEEYETHKQFPWNGQQYHISMGETKDYFEIKNNDGSPFLVHSLEGYNYINGISFITVNRGSTSYLCVLSRLRATSHNAILNLFSADGKLLYEELIGRFNILETGEVNGEQVIVIGNKDFRYGEFKVTMPGTIYQFKD